MDENSRVKNMRKGADPTCSKTHLDKSITRTEMETFCPVSGEGLTKEKKMTSKLVIFQRARPTYCMLVMNVNVLSFFPSLHTNYPAVKSPEYPRATAYATNNLENFHTSNEIE